MGTRIGFYGGTFDPPHMGHTAAAAAFAAAVRPDRLYIIPNYLPPLKDGRVPARLRTGWRWRLLLPGLYGLRF